VARIFESGTANRSADKSKRISFGAHGARRRPLFEQRRQTDRLGEIGDLLLNPNGQLSRNRACHERVTSECPYFQTLNSTHLRARWLLGERL
jgi:hypothetical protein